MEKIFNNIDTSIKPGDNFYKFATGNWIKYNPQPAEYPTWTNFGKLDDDNILRIQDIIMNPGDSILNKKLNTLYNIFMNYERRNSEGLLPLKKFLTEKLYPIATYEEFFDFIASEKMSMMFYVSIDTDMKNSKEHIISLYQGGMSLSNKEYYISKEPENKKVLNAYKVYLKEILSYYGYDEKETNQRIKKFIKLETKMARVAYSIEDMMEPSINYHKMSVDELTNMTNFDWKRFLTVYGFDKTTEVNIAQIDPIKKGCKLLLQTPLEDLKDYLETCIIADADSCLDDTIYDIGFNFSQVMTGAKEQLPKWKRAVNIVDNLCSDIIGQIYVEKYFSETAKQHCEKLVRLLKKSFEKIIRQQQWMSDETKGLAVEKLREMNLKIGYPNKFDDVSDIPVDDNISYFDNLQNISKFYFELNKKKHYNKPVDPDEWFMSPQSVNAYYAQDLNEIVFPAAILQYPYYSEDFDIAMNFGAIGTIIGHEMTHGFDNHGRQYDIDGNMNDWWKQEDIDKFNDLIKYTEIHYNTLDVLSDLKCNGSLTLSENLADYGGLKIAYYALKDFIKEINYIDYPEKYNGYNWEQRFFIAFANTEAGVTTEETIRKNNINNEHAAMHVRINGALSMFTPWYNAFNIQSNDNMYIDIEQRAKIW